jgi:hypothetical protein
LDGPRLHHPARQSVSRSRGRPAGDLAYGLRNPWRFSFDSKTGAELERELAKAQQD